MRNFRHRLTAVVSPLNKLVVDVCISLMHTRKVFFMCLRSHGNKTVLKDDFICYCKSLWPLSTSPHIQIHEYTWSSHMTNCTMACRMSSWLNSSPLCQASVVSPFLYSLLVLWLPWIIQWCNRIFVSRHIFLYSLKWARIWCHMLELLLMKNAFHLPCFAISCLSFLACCESRWFGIWNFCSQALQTPPSSQCLLLPIFVYKLCQLLVCEEQIHILSMVLLHHTHVWHEGTMTRQQAILLLDCTIRSHSIALLAFTFLISLIQVSLVLSLTSLIIVLIFLYWDNLFFATARIFIFNNFKDLDLLYSLSSRFQN